MSDILILYPDTAEQTQAFKAVQDEGERRFKILKCHAGAVPRSPPSGSLSATTHALFARKVQRKLGNDVAGFATEDHL
jgi:hypothetical protein